MFLSRGIDCRFEQGNSNFIRSFQDIYGVRSAGINPWVEVKIIFCMNQ